MTVSLGMTLNPTKWTYGMAFHRYLWSEVSALVRKHELVLLKARRFDNSAILQGGRGIITSMR
jgi:hypothetical protein